MKLHSVSTHTKMCACIKTPHSCSAPKCSTPISAWSQEGRLPTRGIWSQQWDNPPHTPSLSLKPSAASREEWQMPCSLQVLTGGTELQLRGAQLDGNLGHLVRS